MILGEAKCPFHKLVCLHETDTDETDNGKEQHAGASRDHETEKLLREARLVYVHRVSLPARHEQDEENEQEPEPEAQDHSVFQGLQHHRLNVRGYGCTVNEIARSSRSDLRGAFESCKYLPGNRARVFLCYSATFSVWRQKKLRLMKSMGSAASP